MALYFYRCIIFSILILSLLRGGESLAQWQPASCIIKHANLIYKGDEPPAPIKLTPIIRTVDGVSAELTLLSPGESEVLDVVFDLPKKTHQQTAQQDEELHQIAKYLTIASTSIETAEILQKLKLHQKQFPELPISIRKLGPPVMQEKTNTYCAYAGPNCWNAALTWFFPKTTPEYTSPEVMESNLQVRFHVISTNDSIRYGDLIAIRQSIFGSDYLLHTAIYLGNGLVWHKGGAHPEYPYVFSTLKNMFRDYENKINRGGVYHETYRLNQHLN